MRNLEASCPLTSTLPNALINIIAIFLTSCLSVQSTDLHKPEAQGMREISLQQVTFFNTFFYYRFLTCLQISKMRTISLLQQSFWSKSPRLCLIKIVTTLALLRLQCVRKKRKLFGKLTLPQNESRFPGCTQDNGSTRERNTDLAYALWMAYNTVQFQLCLKFSVWHKSKVPLYFFFSHWYVTNDEIFQHEICSRFPIFLYDFLSGLTILQAINKNATFI